MDFFLLGKISYDWQHRVAELALKEAFGASVLTSSQDCQFTFHIPESETQVAPEEHRNFQS